MALEDCKSQRQSDFHFLLQSPYTCEGKMVRELGDRGEQRWAGGNGGRATAALVRMLIPLFTFPGQNPVMC